ncbi:hypothetical protein BATDEDRAFT_35063 [Batrachochytrium dendrobatidis JAM81]|uniref:Uncharacterized protein n=2 Tax=Batrachochytrium dendrobatidis TaxID=109871 RepID=F4P373_BATDJ|nr:uncharacterized protein BATDEDRAFT_35063 [Batrachochytrium dendrobatidis JAM81]EGF80349.1 hypothetical protein BATDEDRAFT_35063 [Batrachochytrium dendrobatidis JAM81]OAJ41333.1 hypothetical protein BDEG_24954 [Batrachochytrium dendrobatidis JEL423]|eukprot:XP_006679095.1 hypothetical protein BATDEDRAFT_35063 [Batrachochytrium dendrobatidis JAM81]
MGSGASKQITPATQSSQIPKKSQASDKADGHTLISDPRDHSNQHHPASPASSMFPYAPPSQPRIIDNPDLNLPSPTSKESALYRLRQVEEERNNALLDKRRFAVLLSEAETASATRNDLVHDLEQELRAQMIALKQQTQTVTDLKECVASMYTALCAYKELVQKHIDHLDPLVYRMQDVLAHDTAADTTRPNPQFSTLSIQASVDTIEARIAQIAALDSSTSSHDFIQHSRLPSVGRPSEVIATHTKDTLPQLISDYIQLAYKLKTRATKTLFWTEKDPSKVFHAATNGEMLSFLNQSYASGFSQSFDASETSLERVL